MNTASREEKRQAVAVRGRKRGASNSRSQTTRPAAASVSAAAGDVKAEESKSVVMDVKEENVIVPDNEEKPNGSVDLLDDKPEQVENKTEETSHDFTVTITDETEMELVHDTVVVTEDSGEGDESADCILEDVLLIDSEDGIDEDTTLNNETDDDAKPRVAVGSNDDDMVEFLNSLGLKGAVGFLELSITGVPLLHVVTAETREVRQQRKIVVHLVKPADFASTVLQDIVNSDTCVHLRMECDRPLNDVDSWTGELELYFGSATAAAAAAENLCKMRDGIEVDYGQPLPVVDTAAAGQNKMLEEEMKPWIDLILLVKNVGSASEACKVKLAEMFPDADIAFHKDSSSEFLKGQAYLVFSSKQKADEAIKNFKRERPRIDGQRLILIRWNPKRVLPSGMLRIGERRLVMLTMLQMESRLAKGDDPSLNAKYKALGDVVGRDTKARHACGIPAPSYNQLKGLHDVRHYADAEQALILRRLLQPYNCGNVDTPSKQTPAASGPPSAKFPTAENKLAAKNMKSPLFQPNKQASVSNQHSSDSGAPDEKNKAGDGKPSDGPVKKTASWASGKDFKSKSETANKPLLKSKVYTKPPPTNRRLAVVAAAKSKLRGSGTFKPRSLLDMAVRRPTNAGYSLLGMRPPLNEPRMQGPLLQAPYELLPPPLSMERRDRPLLPSSPPPPRSAMHMQSPGGFHHEPSPPSNRGSLLGSYPGELEMTGARRGSVPMRSDRLEDPMPKMRRMDDDRPMMRQSPDYDRRPNYMEEENRFQSDQRTRPMMGRMPEERDDRSRNVVSIFDINDRLRREDVDDQGRGPVAVGGNRIGPEHFGSRRNEDEEMMAMQRGRPLMRGSVEPRGSSWDDRANEREQPVPYNQRVQDRRMPPKNPPVPSLMDTMDRGSHEFLPDRRQQRKPTMDSAMMRDQGQKHLGRDRPGPSMQDDFKQSTYYQSEPENMPSGRPSIAEHGSSYGRDRDDRNSWASERSDRFGKLESEEMQSTKRQSNQTPQSKRQSNQTPQSSEQSDPVSLLLNLSQLLADKLQRDKEKDKGQHRGDY